MNAREALEAWYAYRASPAWSQGSNDDESDFLAGAEWQASQPPATADDRDALKRIIYTYETIDFAESRNFTTRDCYGVVEVILAAGFTRSQSSPDWTDEQVEAALASWFESATHAGTYAEVAEHVKERNRPRMLSALSAASTARTTKENTDG